MVKKWILIFVIIAILLLGSFWEDNYVNSTFDYMVERLNTYESMLVNSQEDVNTQDNIGYLQDLHSSFHEKEKVLKMLIWHTGLKDIEVSISRIKSYVKENDFTEAITETRALIDYCEHYSLDFSVTMENIL